MMKLVDVKTMYLSALGILYDSTEAESIFFQSAGSMLNYSKIEIRQNLNRSIDSQLERNFMNCLDRLRTGEPVQYVVGSMEFCEALIRVDRRVLVPRPETEFLTDMIIRENIHRKNLHIIDLCTGSGCIGIAIAKKLENVQISATDISTEALALAQLNSIENQAVINFIEDDILNPVSHYLLFDLIVSNPPYVRELEKKQMHINVLNFEPSIALYVPDTDPLLFYRAIADFGLKHLTQRGLIYLELNENFGREVKSLFLSGGYSIAEIRKDLREKDRYLIASI
jgi:release factor glutamine methyltransferase